MFVSCKQHHYLQCPQTMYLLKTLKHNSDATCRIIWLFDGWKSTAPILQRGVFNFITDQMEVFYALFSKRLDQ